MPAANFGRSDYVTLALLISYSDFEDDSAYMAEVREQAIGDLEYRGITVEDYEDPDDFEDEVTDAVDEIIERDITDQYNDAWSNAEYWIKHNYLRNITLELHSGYYEGIWLEITLEPADIDDESDKDDMYAQISKVGEFLLELADEGWRSVSSSTYMTHRSEYEETCEDIADAIRGMTEEVQNAKVYDVNEPEDWTR